MLANWTSLATCEIVTDGTLLVKLARGEMASAAQAAGCPIEGTIYCQAQATVARRLTVLQSVSGVFWGCVRRHFPARGPQR